MEIITLFQNAKIVEQNVRIFLQYPYILFFLFGNLNNNCRININFMVIITAFLCIMQSFPVLIQPFFIFGLAWLLLPS